MRKRKQTLQRWIHLCAGSNGNHNRQQINLKGQNNMQIKMMPITEIHPYEFWATEHLNMTERFINRFPPSPAKLPGLAGTANSFSG